MSELRDAAMKSKAWPFEEARRLKARADRLGKDEVIFETGYGPSGLPHIGTFGEVLRTTMVRRAFQAIDDRPTRLICFSDDLDGMRKVPDNVPQREMLAGHLHKPLTDVPDPFGTHESFGHHNNAMLRRFLDTFGFEYEFVSAREFYRSGRFDEVLRLCAARYDDLMAIMLKSLRDERRETYSIFLPIHPETGRVLYVPMKHVDGEAGTVTFDDPEGREWTLPVTGGHVKLQWKPDFGARWAALGVDFEMYGKEHGTNTAIYDAICRALGGTAPEHLVYELFLDEHGQKISKSSGNGISMDQWLAYAPAESLAYFMFLKPKTAKRLHLDVIPKAVDEYHQQLRAFHEANDPAARAANPVWHIHGGDVPRSDMVVPFAMLLNLAGVANTEDPEVFWGFVKRYAPEASPETHPGLDAAIRGAIAYYRDVILPTRSVRAPDARERAAMEELAGRLEGWEGDANDAEGLQSEVFAVGKAHGFEPLRDWFRALYEVLFGASQGPRFGGFAALYGPKETAAMIRGRIG
ncbi:MAG: lysine--tRNA ligase [Hasllibacter sp.]